MYHLLSLIFFFFNDTATTEIYTLSLHDALPISAAAADRRCSKMDQQAAPHVSTRRSEEHTSELQSPDHLVCRLLLEKKKKNRITTLERDAVDIYRARCRYRLLLHR